MYRADDIKSGLLHLVGWRQYYDTSEFELPSSLAESESGQYFQDFHPLLTLDNVQSIAPDFNKITIPAWEDTPTVYSPGDRVSYNNINYRAIEINDGKQPDLNPAKWEVFDAFGEWLENKTGASILKAIQNFWVKNLSDKSAKNILESKPLFKGAGRITDIIENDDNLVGFELVVPRYKGATVKVEKVGLQFKGTGDVVLKLYHSSQAIPLKTLTFTRTNDGGMQWFQPTEDLFLPFISDDIDSGGSWYLVYERGSLPGGMNAINKSKDWSKEPCSTCDGNEYSDYLALSKYLEVYPFKVADGEFVSGEMWDVQDNLYTNSTNYGINLQITVECDITDIVLEQSRSFQNVIGLQVAVDMIREFAYNANFRIGRTQQNFKRNELLYELDGDSSSEKPSGLVWELSKAMKGVSLDMKGTSRLCFPCNNGGIRYRTV